jgi:hypothetical protein
MHVPFSIIAIFYFLNKSIIKIYSKIYLIILIYATNVYILLYICSNFKVFGSSRRKTTLILGPRGRHNACLLSCPKRNVQLNVQASC